jgi:putative transposase
MSDYRRAFQPGGTFFFTLVTQRRVPILCRPLARTILNEAIAKCRTQRPFHLTAIVLLPDHLHAIWTLSDGDADFSTRWAAIKAHFTHEWLARGGYEVHGTESRAKHRNRGVWQRRFWEHAIRDEGDFERHLDYIHYNPVKHGLSACPHAWRHSSFAKWVKQDVYEQSWQCVCHGDEVKPPDFSRLDGLQME